MESNNLDMCNNPENLIIPFSDEIEFEDGFICDIIEESSIEDTIPDYVLEKILWY